MKKNKTIRNKKSIVPNKNKKSILNKRNVKINSNPIVKEFEKKKPVSVKLNYIEPSDPLNLRKMFIDNEVKYIRENDVYDYTFKLFKEHLEDLFNRFPSIYWRNDKEYIDDVYNEILERSAKYIEQKKLIQEKQDIATTRKASTTKGLYTKFLDRFENIERKINLYMSDDNKTTEKFKVIDKDISQFLKTPSNIFDVEELKEIGKSTDYIEKIEFLKAVKSSLLSKPENKPVDTSDFLKIAIKPKRGRAKVETIKPSEVKQIKRKNVLVKPKNEVKKTDEDYEPILTDIKDLDTEINDDKKKVDTIIKEIVKEEVKKEEPTTTKIDAVVKEVVKEEIQKSDDIIQARFKKMNAGVFKKYGGQKQNILQYALDNNIEPLSGETDLAYVSRIVRELSSKLIPAKKYTTSTPSKLISKDDEVFDSDKTPIKASPIPDKFIEKKLLEIKEVEEAKQELFDHPSGDVDADEEHLQELENKIQRITKEMNEYEKKKKSGEGFFKDTFNKIKHIILNTGSPQTDKMVKKYGDYYVKRAMIHRKPVDKILKDIINVISLGQFNNYKRDYDDVFHLAVILQLENKNGNTVYLLTEKRPNIFWKEVSSLDDYPSNDDKLQVKLESFKPVSFAQMIEETKKIMGDKFNKYQAKDNNCQVWILSLFDAFFKLVGMDINNPVFKMIKNYIYQDMTPYITKTSSDVANKVTDLGHIFNRILYGASLRKRI